MKVGLYFGSFNPIHLGHLIVANTILEKAELDEVWFIISPQSPFKEKSELASELDRKKMVELAIEDHPKLKASTIEFNLPKPSYTIDTLKILSKDFPDNQFSIIMGTDNLIHFHKWKSFEDILKVVNILVYARSTKDHIPERWLEHELISINQLPLINISSTFIRRKIENGESIKYWIPKSVEAYVLENNLFKHMKNNK